MTVFSWKLAQIGQGELPAIVASAGEKGNWRFLEFFMVNIRNRHTRRAYLRAMMLFLAWCEKKDIKDLREITPEIMAVYIEQNSGAVLTVRQHLSAIRMFFDWLVMSEVITMNPAHGVKGPAHVVKRWKTQTLSVEQIRKLLHSMDMSTIGGLRDRALIGVMLYCFARAGAITEMKVQDYYSRNRGWWFRLYGKEGKFHEVPAHHNAEAYMNACLEVARIREEPEGPLFRSINRCRQLTPTPMNRIDVLQMIKRRARDAGLPPNTCCHTFRATGITEYLRGGGTIGKAQKIAAHESSHTTKLYDPSDKIMLAEIDRIDI
jgi:integrase/recombinase XerD